MSLYNMVNGTHPMFGALLGALGFDNNTIKQIPRIRDCYLYPDSIRILTRTGGGNRPDYVDENQWLMDWPGYINNWDDAFDSTFAYPS